MKLLRARQVVLECLPHILGNTIAFLIDITQLRLCTPISFFSSQRQPVDSFRDVFGFALAIYVRQTQRGLRSHLSHSSCFFHIPRCGRILPARKGILAHLPKSDRPMRLMEQLPGQARKQKHMAAFHSVKQGGAL